MHVPWVKLFLVVTVLPTSCDPIVVSLNTKWGDGVHNYLAHQFVWTNKFISFYNVYLTTLTTNTSTKITYCTFDIWFGNQNDPFKLNVTQQATDMLHGTPMFQTNQIKCRIKIKRERNKKTVHKASLSFAGYFITWNGTHEWENESRQSNSQTKSRSLEHTNFLHLPLWFTQFDI